MVDRSAEHAAATAVAQQLGGEARPRDVRGAPDGTHDFDIAVVDGKVIALEITTAAHRPWVQLNHRVAKQRVTTTPELENTWLLLGSYGYRDPNRGSDIDITALLRKARHHLRRLEETRHEGFDPTTDEAEAPMLIAAAIAGLRRMGISSAHRCIGGSGPARVVLGNPTGYGGFVNPEWINGVVEHEVTQNLAKLERAGADERHLFVWMDISAGAAGISIASDRLPATAPTLPPTITTVWIGFRGQDSDGQPEVATLWRYSQSGAWAIS